MNSIPYLFGLRNSSKIVFLEEGLSLGLDWLSKLDASSGIFC